jgi:metallo-beta-lactamase family protein
MAKVSFLGGVRTVTGSRFLLELKDRNYLIDCGMFQGIKENRLKNWEPFPVDTKRINKVLLTHAHIDHSGYLPRFCKEGFSGQIHCTDATFDLCQILLRDSAHLQEEDADWANRKGFSKHKPALPLYNTQDAEHALTYFKPYHYGEDFFIEDNIRIKFKDAGHILGSALIDIKRLNGNKSKKILFSGDFGRSQRPILNDPVQVFNVDYLIIESTYGNRLHAPCSPQEELIRIINESYDRGGVLVIPSFSVDRTQTLLYVLRELEQEKKIPSLKIYMDSPMAIAATEIFKKRIADYDLTARKLALNGIDIFRPKKLEICAKREESRAINQIKKGAIIISASGMATGGRILHHLRERLPDSRNTILLIGYQVEGSRGRSILEKKPYVKIHGEEIPVNATVENIFGFSGHADYEEILAWLYAFNKPPKKTFVVHGEESASISLAQKIEKAYGWDVVIPKFGESFELDF